MKRVICLPLSSRSPAWTAVKAEWQRQNFGLDTVAAGHAQRPSGWPGLGSFDCSGDVGNSVLERCVRLRQDGLPSV